MLFEHLLNGLLLYIGHLLRTNKRFPYPLCILQFTTKLLCSPRLEDNSSMRCIMAVVVGYYVMQVLAGRRVGCRSLESLRLYPI